MGDFSYSNSNPDYDVSIYGQMNTFLKQLCREAKIDRFDLREEKSDFNGHQGCVRDVLLVREEKPLLSVLLVVQPTYDLVGFRWPEVKVEKKESEFGGRLTKAIEEKTPTVEKKPTPRIQDLHWWIVFRGADGVETTFEGNQFDLPRVKEAFNAIESRLIAEITK